MQHHSTTIFERLLFSTPHVSPHCSSPARPAHRITQSQPPAPLPLLQQKRRMVAAAIENKLRECDEANAAFEAFRRVVAAATAQVRRAVVTAVAAATAAADEAS
jgi:hypothetical protein